MGRPVDSVGALGGSKTIRVWDGCRVVQVITVSSTGSATLGAVGGAHNSTNPDIEIDPWAGLIVDHSVKGAPASFREE